MHIVLYERGGNVPFEAIAAGCQVAGYRTTWQRPSVWTPDAVFGDASAVVVHGLHGNAARIRDAYQARGVPVWIVDLPRLRSEAGAVGLFRESLHYLPATTFRAPVVEPVITPRGTEIILVAGQKPGDAAHGMDAAAHDRWGRATIAAIRAADARQIVYRPHPRDVRSPAKDLFGADLCSFAESNTLRSDLARAACVVVHNSTVGWDAIAAGVHVIATAPRELVAYADYVDLTIDIPMIGGQLLADARAEALGRAASTQWTLDELRNGIAQRACFAGELPELPRQPGGRVDETPTLLPPDDGSFVLGESLVGVDPAVAVASRRQRRRR